MSITDMSRDSKAGEILAVHYAVRGVVKERQIRCPQISSKALFKKKKLFMLVIKFAEDS